MIGLNTAMEGNLLRRDWIQALRLAPGAPDIALLAGFPARHDVTVIRWWVFGVTSE